MSCPNFDAAVQKVATGATGPLKVEGDAGKVEQRPVTDLIAAANYLAGICASKTRTLGLRFTRLLPDGTSHVRYRSPRLGPDREW